MTPDLCVIGGGTAGQAVALGAAALGWRCTVIDPAAQLGRSQAADLAATVLFTMARDSRFPGATACRERIGRAVVAAAPSATAARLQALGVTVLRGEASFVDPRTVLVDGLAVRARRFVVATGAEPTVPPWAVGDPRLVTPRALLAGRAPWPTAMTIVTETPAGLEWAQALSRCGVAVTLHATPSATLPFDAELMALCMAGLRRDGVILRERQDLVAAPILAAGTDAMMLFTRPIPATTALRLERAGVPLQDGAPVVDHALRTRNRRLFALGDVLGRPAHGGAAIPAEVGLLLRAMVFRLPVRTMPGAVPLVLRTVPTLAQVGTLASRPGERPLRLARFPLADTASGACDDTAGLVKIAASSRGTVRGAAILAATAADAVGPWTLAVRDGLTLAAMAALPVPAESAAEAARRAATAAIAARLRAPWIRRVSGWLRRLP